MRGVSGLLACAAAGFACQNILLSLFLVFCAACVLDTKAKLFAQGGVVTCIASSTSQVYPKAFYASLPLGICAFILPALAYSTKQFKSQSPFKKTVYTPPETQSIPSPTRSIANLL